MMPPDATTTLLLTQRLLGIGLAIQSAELILARRIYGSGSALTGGGVGWLLSGRSALSLWLVVAPVSAVSMAATLVTLTLLASSVWLTLRSRGPVCGGSDSMFFQVQLGLFIAALGFLNPLLPKIGLGWIAAQSVLSYFLAGLGKIQNAGWRDGVAIQHLFASNGPYVLLGGVRWLKNSIILCGFLGWSVVIFELAFPAVLVVGVEGKWLLVAMALGFHLANAVVLGLNRFVWAWAATYPAVLYFH